MQGVSEGRAALARAARRVRGRRSGDEDSTPAAGRAAILIVNGFDRHSAQAFDVEEARNYPWIRLCLEQLERHDAGAPYDVLVWDNSFLPEHLEVLQANQRVTVFSETEKQKDVRHGRALDRLLQEVPESTEYVVTMDTDSFPVRDGWLRNLIGRLERGASIAGVWRDEMAPKITPYVHPSCLAARRQALLDLGVDFARKQGVHRVDVGQNITNAVLAAGDRVSSLRRSNARDLHFLMAGLYGDLVYHHGAGSRHANFWTSFDMEADELARVTLRDAAFKDLDRLVDVLAGDVEIEDVPELGLEALAGLGHLPASAEPAAQRPAH